MSAEDYENQIDFDVYFLLSTLPIKQNLEYYCKITDVTDDKTEGFGAHIKLCVKQKCFQIEGDFCEQQEAEAISRNLSSQIRNRNCAILVFPHKIHK